MPLSLHDSGRGTGKTLGQLREILTYLGPIKRVAYILRHASEIDYCMDMLAYMHPPEDENFREKILKYPHLQIHFSCSHFRPYWVFDGPVILDHWAIPKSLNIVPLVDKKRYLDWMHLVKANNKRYDWPQGLGELHDPETT